MQKITQILVFLLAIWAILAPISLVSAQYYNYNYNYNYNACVPHAARVCVNNNLYWFDTCNNQQELIQYCGANQSCQYGQCVTVYRPIIYKKYVAPVKTNPVTVTNPVKTTAPATNNLLLSFVTKIDSTSPQWQKGIQMGQNAQAYFMISIVNNSSTQIDNVNVSANIPGQITSIGNLKVNSVVLAGDIISGVNIGSISAGSSKSVTFEGKTQTFSAQADNQQATANININGVTQSDSLTISFNPANNSGTASVASTQTTSGFMDFLKKWYLWILVGLVLIFLFIVVFRRLSNNN